MQPKLDADANTAEKTLRLFQKLMADGRRHFQSDLAEYLNCSKQTVMRLVMSVERVVGSCLATGLERHRRWYQLQSPTRNRLGLDFEELRYLAICRDLASPYLSKPVQERVDQSIFNLSMLMADQDFAEREKIRKGRVGCCLKGWIDYTPYFGFLEKLVQGADERRICLVSYKSPAQTTVKEHRFACKRIVSMNNALYALGASVTEDCSEMRFLTSLAVHRIRAVTLTDKRWHFRFQEEDLGMFGLPWHEPRTFRIRFKPGKAAEYVRERIWSGTQKMDELEDGGLLLEIVSRSETEVRTWVRSFGAEAEMLEPGSDRESDRD